MIKDSLDFEKSVGISVSACIRKIYRNYAAYFLTILDTFV